MASSITTIRNSRPRVFASSFAGLGLWCVVSTVSIFPSYLAYFNEFIGPEKGYRYLVDFNLDGGQDLKRLKQFIDEKELDQIYLHYFGTAEPCYYGIHSIDLPGSFNHCGRSNDKLARFLAISATHLQSVYLPNKASYDWILKQEPVTRIGYSIFVYDIKENVHNNFGILYLKEGQTKRALEEFKRVLELLPGEATAYVNVGFAHARLAAF